MAMKKNEKVVTHSRSRQLRILGFMTAVFCMVLTMIPAIAEDGNTQTIIDGFVNGTEQVWNILVGVVSPIAGIVLAVCAVKVIWGGTKAAEDAKNTAVKVIVGIAIVMLAPAIIAAVRSWFPKASWSTLK